MRSGCATQSSLAAASAGDVALTYAGLFPDHPGAVILTNTNAGRHDKPLVVEAFGRLGGPEAASIVQRMFAKDPENLYPEFTRVCYPLYSSTPGWVEENAHFLARMIRTPELISHYDDHEDSRFDPWSVLGAVRCPTLVITGEDDPICPLPVVEELARQLPTATTRLVRLPGARHTIFRDRPDLAFPAVKDFVSQLRETTGSLT